MYRVLCVLMLLLLSSCGSSPDSGVELDTEEESNYLTELGIDTSEFVDADSNGVKDWYDDYDYDNILNYEDEDYLSYFRESEDIPCDCGRTDDHNTRLDLKDNLFIIEIDSNFNFYKNVLLSATDSSGTELDSSEVFFSMGSSSFEMGIYNVTVTTSPWNRDETFILYVVKDISDTLFLRDDDYVAGEPYLSLLESEYDVEIDSSFTLEELVNFMAIDKDGISTNSTVEFSGDYDITVPGKYILTIGYGERDKEFTLWVGKKTLGQFDIIMKHENRVNDTLIVCEKESEFELPIISAFHKDDEELMIQYNSSMSQLGSGDLLDSIREYNLYWNIINKANTDEYVTYRVTVKVVEDLSIDEDDSDKEVL